MISRFIACIGIAIAGSANFTAVLAQTAPATPAPAASTSPAAAPASVTLPVPGMAGSLAFQSVPYAVDVGSLGKWYVDGVLSGIGIAQSNPVASDKNAIADISTAQVMISKIDGWWQFYVQAGAYSLPVIGTPYSHVTDASSAFKTFFDAVPQTFFKLQPTDSFSVEAGKLPTLIGAEYTFSFENFNIERGLLWNQEPAVSRGGQANYTTGPVTLSASLNDGYYSNRYNWISGSATWTINPTNTLLFAAGGNVGHTGAIAGSVATPTPQNNSSIYNIIYTYNSAPWTITPYLQFSHVSADANIGIMKRANAYSGAFLANYVINAHFQLAGRFEYIDTDGSAFDPNGTNLLYGSGSKAFSLTITPTYTYDRFFARGEVSLVDIMSGTIGDEFGGNGSTSTQVRGLLEGGVIF